MSTDRYICMILHVSGILSFAIKKTWNYRYRLRMISGIWQGKRLKRHYTGRALRNLTDLDGQICAVKNVVRVRAPLIRIIRSSGGEYQRERTLIILADAWQIDTIGENDDVHSPGSRDGRKMTNGYVNCERARIAHRRAAFERGAAVRRCFTTVLKLAEIRRPMKSVRASAVFRMTLWPLRNDTRRKIVWTCRGP